MRCLRILNVLPTEAGEELPDEPPEEPAVVVDPSVVVVSVVVVSVVVVSVVVVGGSCRFLLELISLGMWFTFIPFIFAFCSSD